MTNPSSPNTARELDDAMARALAYTDTVGLSDGTDRPAETLDEILDEIEADLEARDLYREGKWIG